MTQEQQKALDAPLAEINKEFGKVRLALDGKLERVEGIHALENIAIFCNTTIRAALSRETVTVPVIEGLDESIRSSIRYPNCNDLGFLSAIERDDVLKAARWVSENAGKAISKMETVGAENARTEGLLPCPFCGGEAYYNFTDASNDRKFYRVHCKECDARIGHPYVGKDAARDAWNTRAEQKDQNHER